MTIMRQRETISQVIPEGTCDKQSKLYLHAKKPLQAEAFFVNAY